MKSLLPSENMSRTLNKGKEVGAKQRTRGRLHDSRS